MYMYQNRSSYVVYENFTPQNDMQGAALLTSCACAGWSEPLLCSPAVHVLDGASLCSALRLWLYWMEGAFALLSGYGCAW